MKRLFLHIAFLLATLSAVDSCIDLPDENRPTGFLTDASSLSLPASSSSFLVTVSSGVTWDVTSMPSWLHLQSIRPTSGVPYCWDLDFSAAANEGYDREGTILFEVSTGTTFTVEVRQKGQRGELIPVLSVSLDKTRLALQVYDGYRLVPTITPANAADKSLVWRSDNPSVARVTSDGYVQGLDAGQAIITAETVDGGKTATCTVTVTGSSYPSNYTMVWHDEFTRDGKPSSEWLYAEGGSGAEDKIQYYVPGSQDGVDLAYISDGTLKIKSQKMGNTIYSVRMRTRRNWTYGWFEVGAKMTDVPGSWPSVWMAPVSNESWRIYGEIDLFAYAVGWYGKDKVSSFYSTWSEYYDRVTEIENAASIFHVFACEWTSTEIKFYVDGKRTCSFSNDGKNDYNTWPFCVPFDIKLDLGMGGIGGEVDESQLPAVFEIDYVRVYQK